MGKLGYKTEKINELLGKVEKLKEVPEWAMQPDKPSYTAGDVGALPDDTSLLPDAPTDGKTYGRNNGNWEEVSSGGGTPGVQVGNVTSHTHNDDVIYSEPDTDVWDGVTVSTALEGTGTESDPYLITSCADFLHMNLNPGRYNANVELNQEPIKYVNYFRIEKNLNFRNHNVIYPDIDNNLGETDDEIRSNALLLAVIDGKGIIIENFSSNNSSSVFSNLYCCFIRGINIRSSSIVYDIKALGYGFPIMPLLGNSYSIYSCSADCSCEATIEITGIENDTENSRFEIRFAGINQHSMVGAYQPGKWYGKNTFICNNNPSNKPITIVYFPVFTPDEVSPIELITSYECSPAEAFPADSTTLPGLHVYMGLLSGTTGRIYYNSDVIRGVKVLEGAVSPIPKTTTEMKSTEFLGLLNSTSADWRADENNSNNGYPIFAPVGRAYDGYVHTSTFVTKVAEINHKITFDLNLMNEPHKSDTVKGALNAQGGFDALYDRMAACGELYIKENVEDYIAIYRSQVAILNDNTEHKRIVTMVLTPMGNGIFSFVYNKLTDSYYTSTDGNAGTMCNLTVTPESVAGKIKVNNTALASGQSIRIGVGEPIRLTQNTSLVKFIIKGVTYTTYELYIAIEDGGDATISIAEKNGTYEVTFSSNIGKLTIND